MNTYFFIDGSNRAMVNLLKIKWDEPYRGKILKYLVIISKSGPSTFQQNKKHAF